MTFTSMPPLPIPKNGHPVQALLLVQGRVQGVGFRPFVFRLANQLKLSGSVENQNGHVRIHLAGPSDAIEEFTQRLKSEKPAIARIDQIHRTESVFESSDSSFSAPDKVKHSFEILASCVAGKPEATPSMNFDFPPDLSVCKDCVSELFTPSNTRYLHPFISCTNCGPRYSLMQALPYDRANTSMVNFEMCPSCQQEYQSPADRRFHAQTVSCHQCGPRYQLFDPQGDACRHDGIQSDNEAIASAAQALREGKLIAVKGIGGIHLLCDADNQDALDRLRSIKQRPEKPFALMALNVESLRKFVHIDAKNEARLTSSASPIQLLRKVHSASANPDHFSLISDRLAPNLDQLGCMLPHAPIHYLLFHACLSSPGGNDWLKQASDARFVVTSANLSSEALIADNEECIRQLKGMVDVFLLHDRDIVHRCDDSVYLKDEALRMGRGIAPHTITLEVSTPSVLAPAVLAPSVLSFGAHLKNTFCIRHKNHAYLSGHIGTLDSPSTCARLQDEIESSLNLMGVKPEAIACDKHPDSFSYRLAEMYSSSLGVPLITVQHHEAHLAAVAAEHNLLQESFIGIALDGFGLGFDPSSRLGYENPQPWGGELFHGPARSLQRIGHLSKLPLPGGDQATRQIFRLGAGVLSKVDEAAWRTQFAGELDEHTTRLIEQAYKGLMTSSAGRWFDAVASLLKLRQKVSFEGQAAMELEAAARRYADRCPDENEEHLPRLESKSLAQIDNSGRLDLYPIIPSLLEDSNTDRAALAFHIELADGLARWAQWASAQAKSMSKSTTSSKKVVCGGGCFQNQILREELTHALSKLGFRVFFAETLPTNDAGLSFGQSVIAAQRLELEREQQQQQQVLQDTP